jgi:cullin 3
MMTQNDAEERWMGIGTAVDEIHNRNASTLSFEELYRSSYTMIIQKHGVIVYTGITEKITSHLQTIVKKLADTPDKHLLQEVCTSYQDFHTNMVMIIDILMYMDRTYVKSAKVRTIKGLGVNIYRNTVWEHNRIQGRVIELLLRAIADERSGLLMDDRSLLKSILAMLIEVGDIENVDTYQDCFEQLFLGTTQEFFKNESSSYLAMNSASDYVAKARSRLEEEEVRATALALPDRTVQQLTKIIHAELISAHAKTLVTLENSGFSALLLDDTKMKEMEEMYNLFTQVPESVDYLRDALCDRVKADGKLLFSDQDKDASDPSTFVRGVLKMREKYVNIVDTSFRGEKKAMKRLKESFESFLNVDARAASCLAVYSDELLRNGLKGASEADIAKEVDNMMHLFRYLSDKDVFESFYKSHLAKRLLGGRSVSEDAEKMMVTKLKAECGYQFTSKLEGMFNDMAISRSTRESYKAHMMKKGKSKVKGSKSVDMEVDVLTTGYWPSQNVPPCTLPQSVKDASQVFTDYYLGNHTGRKLSWQTSGGTAEIRANFGEAPKSRRHDLLVTTYQMCILMLFNENATLTLQKIRSETQIPDIELRRHLISLCTPKHRILRKGSKGKGISGDDDTFTFNADYKSKLKRVKIPLVSLKDSGKKLPPGGLPPAVEEDRRHMVEAATVRIMKARKTMSHNELIAEITKQLSVRFNPTPQFIKKRIESLIEREYLERNQDDHRLYVYIA